MDLKGVSKKGVTLINENPGLSPYELLEKGLSQKDYEKIANQSTAPAPATAPVATPTKAEATEPEAPKVAVPKKVEVSSNKPNQIERPSTGSVSGNVAANFRNKKTGQTGIMNASQLDILCRKYPQEFEKL